MEILDINSCFSFSNKSFLCCNSTQQLDLLRLQSTSKSIICSLLLNFKLMSFFLGTFSMLKFSSNFLFLGEDRFCASSCFLNVKIDGNAPLFKVFLPIFVEIEYLQF